MGYYKLHGILWSYRHAGLLVLVTAISGLPPSEDLKCEIHSSLIGHAAIPGVTVTLNCSISAGRRFERLVWMRNGQPVAPSSVCQASGALWVTCAVLVLENVTVEDAGKYECEARKGDHMDKDEFLLHVYSPPKVSIRHAHTEWILNSQQYLSCHATGGYPTPNISLLFNGVSVHPWDRIWDESFALHRFEDNTLLLTVFSVTRESQGKYTCAAANNMGKVKESVAITVRDRPNPLITTGAKYVLTKQGQDVTLTCLASDVLPRDSTVGWWSYNGSTPQFPANVNTSHKLLDSNRIRLSLHVSNVTEQDIGVYTCNVMVLGSSSHADIHLIIKYPGFPKVSALDDVIRGQYRSSLLLTCYATYHRYAQALFSWYRNGSEVTSKTTPRHVRLPPPSYTYIYKNFTVARFNLAISNVTEQDAGYYTCAIKTTVGWNKTDIQVVLVEDAAAMAVSGGAVGSKLAVIIAVITAGSAAGFIILLAVRYLLKRKPNHYLYGNFNSKEYKYDAFITFSSKDGEWVKTHLVPLLDKHNLKYCIHTRDFEIGKTIMDNMAESVYSSRRVISVMSVHYMASKYCRGELDMALYRATEQDDSSLIVIRLDNVKKAKLPKALRNKTFLDYADLEERKHWDKRLLKYLLAKEKRNRESVF